MVIQMAIQYKSKTAEEWISENTVLAVNEFALESDTRKIKIGDGATAYADLSYYNEEITEEFLGTVTTLTIW